MVDDLFTQRNLPKPAKMASAIHTQWKKRAPKEASVNPDALATQIGSLRTRGPRFSERWWRLRPKLREILLHKYEITDDDIFERAPKEGVVGFPEFPRLGPLRSDEQPFRATARGSLFDAVLDLLAGEGNLRVWIRVPAGGGKSLTLRLLNERVGEQVCTAAVVNLDALSSHLPATPDVPLVVEVEQWSPQTDEGALVRLSKRHTVVVLAPFGLPEIASRSASLFGWRAGEYLPTEDWLPRLIEWVFARIDENADIDSSVDASAVQNWLRVFPWVAETLCTPGDVLALLCDLTESGVDDPPEQVASRWLSEVGLDWLPQECPTVWRNQFARDALTSMIRADFDAQTFAATSRPLEAWEPLLDSRHAAYSSNGALPAKHVVEYFRTAGLLRADEQGLVPYPRLLGAVEATACSAASMVRGVESWGRIAADRSRQPALDRCLDTVPPERLKTLTGQVLRAADTTLPTFSVVAAIEALTAAFARRIARGEAVDLELAGQLLALQLQGLVSGPGIHAYPVPASRRDRDELHLTGWEISLATPAPRGFDASDLGGLCPGWVHPSRLDLLAVELPAPPAPPIAASPELLRLMVLAPRVLHRQPPKQVPELVPPLLLPSMLLSEKWSSHLVCTHLEELKNTWGAQWLAQTIEPADAAEQSAVAQRSWQIAGRCDLGGALATVAERVALILRLGRRLAKSLLGALPSDLVRATARDVGLHRRYTSNGAYRQFDVSVLLALTAASRMAAIEGLLERVSPPVTFDEIRDVVSVLPAGDLDLVLHIVRKASADIAGEFVSRIWHIHPKTGLQEAMHAFERSLPSVEVWFVLAPRQYLAELIAIAQAAHPRPEWVRNWAVRRATDAGRDVDDLYALASPSAAMSRSTVSSQPVKSDRNKRRR
jgi:hypothetical protein